MGPDSVTVCNQPFRPTQPPILGEMGNEWQCCLAWKIIVGLGMDASRIWWAQLPQNAVRAARQAAHAVITTWARGRTSLFRRFTDTDVYRTGSVKIWKTRRTKYPWIYGYLLQCRVDCSDRQSVSHMPAGRWCRRLVRADDVTTHWTICRALSPATICSARHAAHVTRSSSDTDYIITRIFHLGHLFYTFQYIYLIQHWYIKLFYSKNHRATDHRLYK